MKLKTIVTLILERSMSMGYGSLSSNDTQLRPMPRNWEDDSPDWDGIVEGNDWFCYMEGNDWNKKLSGASVYISEDTEPHKMWIKIKTHGLRKSNDTNQSYKDRIRKHTNKVAKAWISAAKDLHKNCGINDVGNPTPITWKKAFKDALNNQKVKMYIANMGEQKIEPISDPINFTQRT